MLSDDLHTLNLSGLRDLLHAIPVPLFIRDVDGRLLMINRACEEDWGVRFEDIQGTRGEPIFPPEDLERYITKNQEVFLQNQTVSFEEGFWSAKHNSYRVGHTFKAPMFDSQGKPLLIIGTRLDITERKLAEQALIAGRAALEDSELRYRTLVEWFPDAVAVHAGGYVRYVNPAAVRLLGATSEDQLLNKHYLELVHPDYHTIVKERVQRTLDTQTGNPLIEEKFLRLDGYTVDVEVVSTPIIYDGETAAQVVFRNQCQNK